MADYITAEGKKQLEDRLEYLKVVGRAEMAEKIRVAREQGDLSENAEYDIARDEQAKMEAEILDIETRLHDVVVIDEKINNDKVDVGHEVRLKDMNSGEEFDFQIVGTHEADPLHNLISNESPLGRAILGKKVGSVVSYKTRVGEAKMKILSIN